MGLASDLSVRGVDANNTTATSFVIRGTEVDPAQTAALQTETAALQTETAALQTETAALQTRTAALERRMAAVETISVTTIPLAATDAEARALGVPQYGLYRYGSRPSEFKMRFTVRHARIQL